MSSLSAWWRGFQRSLGLETRNEKPVGPGVPASRSGWRLPGGWFALALVVVVFVVVGIVALGSGKSDQRPTLEAAPTSRPTVRSTTTAPSLVPVTTRVTTPPTLPPPIVVPADNTAQICNEYYALLSEGHHDDEFANLLAGLARRATNPELADAMLEASDGFARHDEEISGARINDIC